MSLRIRQIVIAAQDLEATVDELCQVLGVRVAYRDPEVAAFGLSNAMMTIGDQLLEVVSPMRDETAAGRHLDRHGDSPYMLILQTDDLARDRARIEDLGVRVVWEAQRTGIRAVHLHPKDVGGAILSLDEADPPESWPWAGEDWAAYATADGARRVTAATLGARDPGALAAHWARILGIEAQPGMADSRRIALDGGELRFEPAAMDALSSFTISMPDVAAACETARGLGWTVRDGVVSRSGLRLQLQSM